MSAETYADPLREVEERSACECGSLLIGGVQMYCARCEEPVCLRCFMRHKCAEAK